MMATVKQEMHHLHESRKQNDNQPDRNGKAEEMAWEMGKLSACRVPFMTSDGYLAGGCTPSASNVHGNVHTLGCVLCCS